MPIGDQSRSSFFNKNTGSLFQQTESSLVSNISGSSAVFGPSTQSTFGNNSAPFCGMHNSVAPLSGSTGCSTFSVPPCLSTSKFEKSDGHEFLYTKPIFGQPNSAIGTIRELGNGGFRSGSSFFNNSSGNLFQQPRSSAANQISGSSTVLRPSTQSTFGNNGAPISGMHNSVTPLSGSTRCPTFSFPCNLTASEFEESDGHESLNSKPIFGQPNSAIGSIRELENWGFSSGSSFFNSNGGNMFQQIQSSSANQISGSSTVFGPSTQSTFGNSGAAFFGMHNSVTPLSGSTGHATFSFPPSLTTSKCEKSDGHESLNPKPIFCQPNSNIGTNRELQTGSFTSGSCFFNNNIGTMCQETQSSSTNQISSSSTVFGSSSQFTFGNSDALSSRMHNSIRSMSGFTGPAVSFPSALSFTTFNFGKSDNHESPGSYPSATESHCRGSVIASYVATPAVITVTTEISCDIVSISAMPAYKDKSHEEIRFEDYQLSRKKGPKNMTSIVSNKEFGASPIECQWEGSRLSPYAATAEAWDFTTTSAKIVSICAMPAYEHKSHEELKFEDYLLTRGKGCCKAENQFEAGLSASPGSESVFSQLSHTNRDLGSGNFRSGSYPSATESHCQGSAIASYVATPEVITVTTEISCEIVSISAMPAYKDKSHEEIRFEDYQLSRKKGPENMTSIVSNKEFGPSPIECQWQGSRLSPYAATPEVWNLTTTSAKIVSICAMPAYEYKSHEELKFKDYLLTRGKGCCKAGNQFEAGLSASTARNLAPGTTSGFSSGMNNIISTKIQFVEPSVGTENSLSESTPAQNHPDKLREISAGRLQPGMAPLNKTEPSFTSNSAPISISNQPSAGTSSQKINIQEFAAQSNLTIGWSPVTNPFAGEPTIQIDCPVSSTKIQYGISSLSVNDNTSTMGRRSSGFKPERDHEKVPFFDEGLPYECKFKSHFIPRGNQRAWLLHPTEERSTETKISKSSTLEDKSNDIHDTGISSGSSKEKDDGSSKFNLSLKGICDDDSSQEGKMHIISKGHQDDEDATVLYTHTPDVQRKMPKLQCPEHYTIPTIDELAAKEKTQPGFCHHIKDFVVGRYGYGSIKFLGETDVTNLDLESIVKFNYREVIVYMDETKKPPVGQGFNKPAEITLLNVKCIDKNTGRLYVEGPMVDKYRQMLMKKGAEQGVEFVSYDPASGEWKFRVLHLYSIDHR